MSAIKNANLYDIIVSPVVTEKSQRNMEANQYFFNVLPSVNKQQIKQAVEEIFKVKVLNVSTLNRKGKNKLFRGHAGKRCDVKRAMVRLKDGDTISVGAGG